MSVTHEQLVAFLDGQEDSSEIRAEAKRQMDDPESFLRRECLRTSNTVKMLADPREPVELILLAHEINGASQDVRGNAGE